MNMAAIPSLSSLLDSITTVTVVGWLLRITLLATIACLYLVLARRAQPAVRHVVAVGTLFAVVVLPVASKLMPTVPLRVLNAETPTSVVAVPAVEDPAPVTIYVPPVEAVTPATSGAIDAAPVRGAAPARSAGPALGAFIRNQIQSHTNWTRFAIVLWLFGATALLIRIAVAFARARELSARALLVSDEELRVEVERASRLLGVTDFIKVAISHEIKVPMVVGVMQPRIILPAEAPGWSRERLQVVLLHEIAHIRRRDVVWMLFARVVSASLWFHPLVAMLSRHVRHESELACDDLVLATGVRGSDYAEHLVTIARLSHGHNPLPGSALAFAAHSTLERRVASILSSRSRRVNPRALMALVAASFVVFVAIAAVHPTRSESAVCSDMGYTMSWKDKQKLEQKIENKIHNKIQNKIQYEIQNTIQTSIENQIQDYDYDAQYHVAGDDDDEANGGEWYGRAWDNYKKGRFDKAAKGWETAARYGYNPGLSLFNAGCAYALADQSGKAIDALEASFDEGFDDLDAYASDSDLNSLRDDPRFRKFMDTVMNSDEADQRRRSAERDWARLENRKDIDNGDWNSVGIELLRAGDYERAAMAFDNEFELSKNQDENALYNKACARALGGKKEEALKLLEQSIATGGVNADHMEEDPDLVSLHKDKRFDGLVRLARDLELDHEGIAIGKKWEAKNWGKSIPHFQEVANDHPTMGRAWFNLGYAQIKADKPAESVVSFQKALDLKFKPALMMYNLACANALAGNIDAAFNWLEKSEAAGEDVWNYARWDEDLDPLRADPRWKELKKRWKEKEDKHAQNDWNWKDYD
jgi:beta-lactamase regulating signal transducer with metallopeptidase domain/Flp pilus assembly protein TadD